MNDFASLGVGLSSLKDVMMGRWSEVSLGLVDHVTPRARWAEMRVTSGEVGR